MARARHKAKGRWTCGAMLPALAFATAAQAQTAGSAQDYHLPPGTPSPTAAGPVDTDHPIAAPTRPAVVPTPTAIPAIRLPPVPRTERTASPRATPTPQATPTPRAERQQRPETIPAPSAAPSAAAPKPAPSAIPTPAPTPTPSAVIPASPPSIAAASPEATQPQPGQSRPWPWIAGGAAVALLAGAFLFLRRRPTARNETAEEAAPAPVSTAPEPSPPAALEPLARAPRPAPAPPPPASAPPIPPLAAEPRPLEMQLEARHLSRALVNATLAYRLTLTNCGETPLGPLRIAGDIISAHASLAPQDQLTLPDTALATIHQIAALTPGDSVTLSGELRLPIASILPISAGAARVFVPLARFRVEQRDGPAAMRVFVVGQASERPGGALRPFPLDRGPGVDRSLDQRELELPA